MATERKGLDRGWLWAGVAVILVGVFFSARSFTRERLPVRTATVERAALTSTLSTNGRVEPETKYVYPSPIATTVKAVYVQPGDRVPAGKLLVVLDDVEARARLASAESGVKSAQAALETATQNGTLQRNLEALTKLGSTGAASASEVAAARQQLDTAETNIRAAEESAHGHYSPTELARAQAALADAEANAAAARDVVAKTSFRAPIAGTVYSVDARPTEYAEAGKVLLQMADLEHEHVRAYFDEPDIGRLAVGQPIQIKWDAKAGEVWHGHIVRTPITVITYTTRTVGEVIISIDGGDGDLLPDTDVTVTVTTASEADALSIPREALYSENGKPYVFKVVKDGLVRTSVTTGATNLTQAAILAGLNAGDVVATGTTTGQPLQVGVPIKRVE
jgi:HlyD family secretion protein